MKAEIKPGASEIQVARREFAVRSRGASGFGFSAIVGSGLRSNAVIPTASSKRLQDGELVMIWHRPEGFGVCRCGGRLHPGQRSLNTELQRVCMRHLKEAFRLTRAQLQPGKVGKEIDAPARAYFIKHDLSKYLVCPFAHTIGLHQAESPFFGPHSQDVLKPGMTVCIDVSFFGHPEFHGVRIETGYEITTNGGAVQHERWTRPPERLIIMNKSKSPARLESKTESDFDVGTRVRHGDGHRLHPVLRRCEARDPHILALLKKHDILATFYWTGHAAENNPVMVRRVRAAGHETGCHGLYHETLGDPLFPLPRPADPAFGGGRPVADCDGDRAQGQASSQSAFVVRGFGAAPR